MNKKIQRNYLEINSLSDLKDTNFSPKGYRIQLVKPVDFQLNKFFYKNVGKKHRWIDRLVWDNLKWISYLENKNIHTYMLKLNEDLVGYFEIIHEHNSKTSEIAYFGILNDYIGKKFGSYLLSEAIKKCFELNSKKVWLHTCSLDHSHALGNYLNRGMKVFKKETINLTLS